jgi:hypothetical protein
MYKFEMRHTKSFNTTIIIVYHKKRRRRQIKTINK